MDNIDQSASRRLTSSWVVLFALFLLSVGIRAPNIDRPLSTNYEWVTAHTLVTLRIWIEEGITTHRFSPVYTYSNPNDHYIKCPPSGISDSAGNYYYVSYPPFSFILPFVFFKTLGIYPTALGLQIFNLIFHFLSGLLIYAIMCRLYDRKMSQGIFAPALVSFCVYTFSSSPLWYHSNVYFADILVQFFFILSTYLLIGILRSSHKTSTLSFGLLGLSIFLMIYTEWLGVFFAATAFVVCFLYRKKSEASLKSMGIIMLSSVLALSLILFQYFSIDGYEVFWDLAQNRLTERSGHTSTGRGDFYALESHLFMLRSYGSNYFPHLVIGLFLSLNLFIYKGKQSIRQPEMIMALLVLTFMPVVLHHLIFFQFTIIHDIAILKTCVFISVVLGILYFQVQHSLSTEKSAVIRAVPAVVVTLMLSMSVYFYYSHIIWPDEYFSQRLGTEIKNNATPEETVFFKTEDTLGWAVLKESDGTFVIAPQIHYYSGRCIQTIPDLEAAQSHLRDFNKSKGVIFTIQNSRYEIENIERITADEDLSLRTDSINVQGNSVDQ